MNTDITQTAAAEHPRSTTTTRAPDAGALTTALRSLRELRSEVSTWHRPLVWFAGTMIIWGVVCMVGMLVDPRTLAGDPIWAKPLKFTISLSLYAITLAWMLTRIERPLLRRAGWVAGTVGAVASLVEIVVISVQVIRGTASHFNVSTPLDAALYALMGSGAVVMYCATLVVGGLLAFVTTLPDRSLQWALRLGLLIGMVGLSVGFLMVIPSAQQLAQATPQVMGSHSVGGDDASGGLYFLGWNTIHGDLRVAHFIGMHALQVLPLLALLLGTVTSTRLTEGIRLRFVVLTAGAWASVTGLVLWQALRGQSVIRPDSVTWSAIAGLVLIGAVAAGLVTRYARQGPTPDASA